MLPTATSSPWRPIPPTILRSSFPASPSQSIPSCGTIPQSRSSTALIRAHSAPAPSSNRSSESLCSKTDIPPQKPSIAKDSSKSAGIRSTAGSKRTDTAKSRSTTPSPFPATPISLKTDSSSAWSVSQRHSGARESVQKRASSSTIPPDASPTASTKNAGPHSTPHSSPSDRATSSSPRFRRLSTRRLSPQTAHSGARTFGKPSSPPAERQSTRNMRRQPDTSPHRRRLLKSSGRECTSRSIPISEAPNGRATESLIFPAKLERRKSVPAAPGTKTPGSPDSARTTGKPTQSRFSSNTVSPEAKPALAGRRKRNGQPIISQTV